MGKILLLVILAFVVYALWRGSKQVQRAAGDGGAGPGTAGVGKGGKPAGDPERMVACERCKVHLPVGEAVAVDGHWFCSEEHARLTRAS